MTDMTAVFARLDEIITGYKAMPADQELEKSNRPLNTLFRAMKDDPNACAAHILAAAPYVQNPMGRADMIATVMGLTVKVIDQDVVDSVVTPLAGFLRDDPDVRVQCLAAHALAFTEWHFPETVPVVVDTIETTLAQNTNLDLRDTLKFPLVTLAKADEAQRARIIDILEPLMFEPTDDQGKGWNIFTLGDLGELDPATGAKSIEILNKILAAEDDPFRQTYTFTAIIQCGNAHEGCRQQAVDTLQTLRALQPDSLTWQSRVDDAMARLGAMSKEEASHNMWAAMEADPNVKFIHVEKPPGA